MTDPDQPPDHAQAAAQALTTLGYAPGCDPLQQLREVAAQLVVERHSAAVELALLPPGSPQRAARVLALEDALSRCGTALVPLAEWQLDGYEQQHLADVFGLERPGGTA